MVKKETSLNGEELRFLRKRLKISAAEFSQVLGVTPETLSRMENGRAQIQHNVDKLIRFVYVGLAHDRFVNLESIARWNAELQKVGFGARIIAIRDANDQWIAEAA